MVFERFPHRPRQEVQYANFSDGRKTLGEKEPAYKQDCQNGYGCGKQEYDFHN